MVPLPTVLVLLDKSQAYLASKGLDNARREAEWIFSETLHLDRLALYTGFDRPLTPAEVDLLRSRVTRRGQREPLAYVLERQPFCGLELEVGPAVLVPRPETEELVGWVLAAHGPSPLRVLDVGTGSGAIALALAVARSSWSVMASDISPAALAVARRNAARHLPAARLSMSAGQAGAVVFQEADLFPEQAGPWDVVVANLPYIGEDERNICDPETAHEPALALFAGESGLLLMRRLLEGLTSMLTVNGRAWLEHGFRQGAAVRALTPPGFTAVTFRDGAGQERATCFHRGEST